MVAIFLKIKIYKLKKLRSNWQVNEVNINVYNNVYLVNLPAASLQSAFVAHRFLHDRINPNEGVNN